MTTPSPWFSRCRVRLRRVFLLLAAVASTVAIPSARAQDASSTPRAYETRRFDGTPPRIDGQLDDAVWSQVPWAGEFIQREPSPGDAPHQPTEFKILYSDNALFVGFRAHDSEPGKIVAQSARRDGFPGDWVEINIDSRRDRRTAFSFTISASGVKGDEFVSQDGDSWDATWDPIWFAGTRVDEKGWTAEIEIPLSQLRFDDADDQIWGMQITRRIFREEERSNWQFIPPDAPGWVSGFGELHGLRNLQPKRQVEVLPYVLARAERFESERGNPFATGEEEDFATGLDAKLGVTANLTLDATVNPDFGQVEADPSEVNLTAFETFFSERRPFFVEGNSIFDFPLAPAVTGGSFTQDNLFYSRRIGRAPQGSADAGPGEFVDQPDHSSILSAAKLSGKLSPSLTLGVLDAVTAEERAEIAGPSGARRKQPVAPLTNFFAGRVQHERDEGKMAIGGMLTAVNRNLDDPAVGFLARAAYAGGLDFRRLWKDRTYYIEGGIQASHLRGSEESMLRLQRSSARYYQRPDADHVEVDSTRTELSGHAGSVRVGKSGGGHTRFQGGVAWRSPGFETNDLGFLRRADEVNQFLYGGYRIDHPFSIFRRLAWNANQWRNYDFDGQHLSTAVNTNANTSTRNNWEFGFGLTRQFETVSNTELRGGPSMRLPGLFEPEFWVEGDHRRPFSVSFGGDWTLRDDDAGRSRTLWIDFIYRPSNQIRITFAPTQSHGRPELQFVTRTGSARGTEYVFAALDQKTLDLTTRIDYAITPTLSLQYYGQPFVSAGRYRDWKRIVDPRNESYEGRFHQLDGPQISHDEASDEYVVDEDRNGEEDFRFSDPDFNVREFHSNLVARWEFRPGSLAYLVWSQGRDDFEGIGRYRPRRDLDSLFDTHPHNVFLVKVSRWFSL